MAGAETVASNADVKSVAVDEQECAHGWVLPHILTLVPANVEVKATLKNRSAALATAGCIADSGPEILLQEDVFFHCESDRLKLRIFHSSHGELIRYQREDRAGARRSNYLIAQTSDPYVMREILAKTLGVVGTVNKTRTLFLAGQTRIHIDQVDGLGDFLELEVVLRPGQPEEDGERIAKALLNEFKVDPEDQIAVAYVDLLASKSAKAS